MVTSLTKHQLFRDYLGIDEEVDLLLPNGYRRLIGQNKNYYFFETKVSSHTLYSHKLYPYLKALDSYNQFREGKIQRFLAQSIGLIGKVPVGLTITTVSPDADPESTTVDGQVRRSGVNETFATIRAGAGNAAFPSETSSTAGQLAASTTSNQYGTLSRFVCLFDTSSIPDTDVISSATLSLYGRNVVDGFGGSQAVGIVTSTPASNTNIVTGDYANFGTTRQASDIDLGSWVTSAYNDFPLNATGLASISKTGITKFGARISGDIDNSAPTWGSSENAQGGTYAKDNGSLFPSLAITHAVPKSGTNPMFFSTGGQTLG